MKLQTLLNSNFLVNSNREERLNKSSPEKNYPVDPKLEYLQRVYSHEKYTQAKEALTRSRNLKITCVYSKTQDAIPTKLYKIRRQHDLQASLTKDKDLFFLERARKLDDSYPSRFKKKFIQKSDFLDPGQRVLSRLNLPEIDGSEYLKIRP